MEKTLLFACAAILTVTLCATIFHAPEVRSVAAQNSMPTYSGGSGTKDDPYLISKAEDFVTMAEFLFGLEESDYIALDAKDACGLGGYHGYYFKQTAYIDMANVAWSPFNFCGVYDGCGYEIKNLKVSEHRFDSYDVGQATTVEDEYEAGFFSQLVHAELLNMTFRDCSATIASMLTPKSERDVYVAIVAATAIASRMENVRTINCTVRQNAEESNFGYAGQVVGFADICNFTNCSAEGGSVTAAGNAKRTFVGGLIGCCSDMYYAWGYMDYYKMQIGAGQPFGVYNCFSSSSVVGLIKQAV